MTHAEVLLWNCIRRRQIHNVKFRRQFSIDNYILDFFASEIKLAIEIDGATHVTDDELQYDVFRQTSLENAGVIFLRFTNAEVYEALDNVVERISEKVSGLLNKTPS
jgi:very-short-patch-repair endonuclease